MSAQTEVYAPETAQRRWSEMEGRFLNHVELVYQPGERGLAGKLFELLGYEVRDRGGTWLSFAVNGAGQTDLSNNAVYASEIQPDQRRLQLALEGAAADPEVRAAYDAVAARRRQQPQVFPHFGLRLSEQAQADVIARIESLDDPELKDRVEVRVFRPGDPDSVTPAMIQAFVYSDIVSFATSPFGMLMELQVVVDEAAMYGEAAAPSS